ncbi:hypothetical protein FACS189487_06700 [Campylobacterota bacterium]|nr:hypothetical protein FACS189487_06700 [Campylobacterota bacterium]
MKKFALLLLIFALIGCKIDKSGDRESDLWSMETRDLPGGGERADIWFSPFDKYDGYITLAIDGIAFDAIDNTLLTNDEIGAKKHIVCEISPSYGGEIRCGWLQYNKLLEMWIGNFDSAAWQTIGKRLTLTVWQSSSKWETSTIYIDQYGFF